MLSGTMLVKKNYSSVAFFQWWRDETNRLLNTHKVYKGAWGAWDQHVLGEFLNTKTYNKPIKKKDLIFNGFPCCELNNIVCEDPAKEDLHIIHYKGKWRNVLSTREWDKSGKDQKSCQKMYNLWIETLDRWNQRKLA